MSTSCPANTASRSAPSRLRSAQTVPITYVGLLPDLFKEGKGMVAQGMLASDGVFRATEVLAKHDENYMPPPAKAAIDRAHKE